MSAIAEKIKDFQETRLKVYNADGNQITRDARAAERAIKDHAGRWIFELLQNCDDAKANRVEIHFDQKAVYIADNGKGLKPSAITALCGTDFSDKSEGTIGRKGIGFKSVYEISSNPIVLNIHGEGVEFNQTKARDWLLQNNFPEQPVPHQWIPFLISWHEAIERFPAIESFSAYKTIVVLPCCSGSKEKIEQVLQEWPPFSLLTFRNLRGIKTSLFEIVVKPDGAIWEIKDNRQERPIKWKVKQGNEKVPQKILETLNEDERRFIERDGVSFLIAAPVKDKDVVPTEGYLPVFVFYPTEQKGPVPLLLHAEFLVKSDRTAVLPVDSTPFNRWVTEKLAIYICDFVQNAYSSKNPSSHLALLLPFGERSSHPLASDLWNCIASAASEKLRIGNAAGEAHLPIDKVRFISVSVRPELARRILEKTEFRDHLPHAAFDEDKNALKVLEYLDCKPITDADLVELIATQAPDKIGDHNWLWKCWEWLASWLEKERWGNERNKRIETIKDLPIIPVRGRVCKPSELEGKIVTWHDHDNEQFQELPDWLPLVFVDDWFRDRIQHAEDESSIAKMLEELSIKEPDENVIRRAVSKAISAFWEKPDDQPGRFLSFIMNQDWYQKTDKATDLQRCPVPVRREKHWEKANTAYLGREWGNDLLEQTYARRRDVAWVRPLDSVEHDKQREVLMWLGVADCPRIIDENWGKSLWSLPEEYKDWEKFLRQERDPDGRSINKVNSITRMDKISPGELDTRQAVALMRLLAKHWSAYYKSHSQVRVEGTRYRELRNRRWEALSLWWYDVKTRLTPHLNNGYNAVPFEKCWLPDKHTARAIGELLPVIDTSAFGEDETVVREWLENEVKIRNRIDQLSVDEWKEILTQHIPRLVPAQRIAQQDSLRNKVTHWYEGCLETAKDADDFSDHCFADCPVLCRKDDHWAYVTNEEARFIEDDPELATAFRETAWLISIPSRLKSVASRFMAIPSLSELARVMPFIPNKKDEIPEKLMQVLKATLPYVYAVRCSQSQDFRDNSTKERERLKSIKCWQVPDLKTDVMLNGIRKVIERNYLIQEGEIFLRSDSCNEPVLAQALTEILDIKSDADFYENLLRCKNEQERKEKLRSKGLTEADIQRVDEYNEAKEEPILPYSHFQEPISPNSPNESEKPSAQPSHLQESSFPKPQPVFPEIPHPGPDNNPDAEKIDINLVDAEETLYDVTTDSPTNSNQSRETWGTGGGSTSTHRSLSQEEKLKIEECSRTIAFRELQKMGYNVEVMPFENPGYDLKATKPDCEELHVEVKAHIGKAKVVELTVRQYKEFLLANSSGEYAWQLWNIENLEAGNGPPTITKISEISEDALDVRTLRVDLQKCKRA